MDPFIIHRGRIAVLDWTDVNTDLIIPARYLKRIERTGYGPLLFADKRYAAGRFAADRRPRRPRSARGRLPSQPPRVQGRDHPPGGPQLRLRLEPRTRGLGRRSGGISCA